MDRSRKGRVKKLEQRTPPVFPEVHVELIGSRDQHYNRHCYQSVPSGEGHSRLVPVPGYTPPAQPHEVNNTVNESW